MARIYDDDSSRIHLVFSMREEFLGKMDLFREQIPALFHNDSQLRLKWFDEEQARQAIRRPPAEKPFQTEVQKDLESAVIEDLLRDHPAEFEEDFDEAQRIEPAQLQIICDTLWDRAQKTGQGMIRDLYDQLDRESQSELVRGLATLENTKARRVLGWRFETSIAGSAADPEQDTHAKASESGKIEPYRRLTSKAELDILAEVLPLLRTPENTKRIREVDALAHEINDRRIARGSSPESPEGLLEALHVVLKCLADVGLINLEKKDKIEYAELAHDYLVKSLDALQLRVRTLRARNLIRTAMEAYRNHKELIVPEVLQELEEHREEIQWTRDHAILLLESALSSGACMQEWFAVAQRTGVSVWNPIQRRLNDPNLDRADSAFHAMDLLEELRAPESVQMLSDLMERADLRNDLRENALSALARLARNAPQNVADAARRILHEHPSGELDVHENRTGQTLEGVLVTDLAIKPRGELPRAALQRLLSEGGITPFIGSPMDSRQTRELHKRLAEDIGPTMAPDMKLPRLASYFVDLHEDQGSATLNELAAEVFSVPHEIVPICNYLAGLDSHFLIVCATYDSALEEAFQKARKPFDIVTHSIGADAYAGSVFLWRHGEPQAQAVAANRLGSYVDIRARSVIYRPFVVADVANPPNGREGYRWARYLLTEEDRLAMLIQVAGSSHMPALIFSHLRSRPALFLDWDLEEWTYRRLAQLLRGERVRSRSRSYSVQEQHDLASLAFWTAQNVDAFNVSTESFVRELEEGSEKP